MAMAADPGMRPVVAGCLSKGPTYGQFSFLTGAIHSALVTEGVPILVEK
jgi:hypothetical protein